MNLVIDILRLHHQDGASIRTIARKLGMSRTTVKKYLELARGAGIDRWPMPEEDGGKDRLRTALFPEEGVSVAGKILPDCEAIDREIQSGKKNGVTRHLLWQEYRMAHPEGLGYSRFCAIYSEHRKNRDLRIHLPHQPGAELYVDYSGMKVPIHPVGGDPGMVPVFVAVMGRSGPIPLPMRPLR